jgi:hypothetical protein
VQKLGDFFAEDPRLLEATKALVAKEALDQIAAVYMIEDNAWFASVAERVICRFG